MFTSITASAFTAGLCWFGAVALPMQAAPQNGMDPASVTVQLRGTQLMHRSPVSYPREAIAKGVQGTVVVQVRLDDTGTVVDASVLSGPDELRKTVLQSVLNWHFAKDSALSTRQIEVSFQLPAGAQAQGLASFTPGSVGTGNRQTQPQTPRTVKTVNILGLSDEARTELLSRLPVHEGDTLTEQTTKALGEAVRAFDSHLGYTFRATSGSEMAVVISPTSGMALSGPLAAMAASLNGSASAGSTAGAAQDPPQTVRVGAAVAEANLVTKVDPVYPQLAKEARIQGTVRFNVTIGKDGQFEKMTLVSGHPLLVAAAQEAMKQWLYKPVLLNGNPVVVVTTVDVDFTLAP